MILLQRMATIAVHSTPDEPLVEKVNPEMIGFTGVLQSIN